MIRICLPNPLPPSTNLFSENDKEDFCSINNFADAVIGLIGTKFGKFFIDEDEKLHRVATLSWAMQVLAVGIQREYEQITNNSDVINSRED